MAHSPGSCIATPTAWGLEGEECYVVHETASSYICQADPDLVVSHFMANFCNEHS